MTDEPEFVACKKPTGPVDAECPLERGHDGSCAIWSQTKTAIWVWRDGRPIVQMDLKPGAALTTDEVGALLAYMDWLREKRP